MSNKVLVIGAVNVDIFSTTKTPYTLEDSNIANISLGFGGVGGNIAMNLNTLLCDVELISAFSQDYLGKFVLEHFTSLGIKTINSTFVEDKRTSVYMGILDENNDLFLGLNDMDLISVLTPSVLKTKHHIINTYDTIVIDTNLVEESLHYLLTTYHNKVIIMDGVSAKKVGKLQPYLTHIDVLKVNHMELDVLSNQQSLEAKIHDVLDQGVTTLLVTNKDQPIFVGYQHQVTSFAVHKQSKIVNATGAGDAFISAYTAGLLRGDTLAKRIKDANAFARLTLSVQTSTIDKGDYHGRKIS
jgi:pseudouridine kinase